MDNTSSQIESGHMLPVMEMFYSLQGEGCHTGKPAFFIRIGGCDVGCAWCDVKESWKASLHPLYPVDEIVRELKKTPAKAAVITGGEPYKYNLSVLTNVLHKAGITVFVETSGTEPLSGTAGWICLSPKKQQLPLTEMCNRADELKVVIHDESDFEWAEACKLRVKPHCLLFLQPEWSVHRTITPLIIDYVKENTHWALSLQTHKYLNIP